MAREGTAGGLPDPREAESKAKRGKKRPRQRQGGDSVKVPGDATRGGDGVGKSPVG